MVKSDMVTTERKIMFWDVWRNMTAATTSWSFGSSSSGNNNSSHNIKKGLPSSARASQHRVEQHQHRYNRLGPPKSHSQPANLTGLSLPSSSSTPSSSLESLAVDPLLTENKQDGNPGAVRRKSQFPPTKHAYSSPPDNNDSGKKGASGMKHSISSFFPFTSCTSSTLTSPAHSLEKQDDDGANDVATKSALQSEDSKNQNKGFLSGIYSAATNSASSSRAAGHNRNSSGNGGVTHRKKKQQNNVVISEKEEDSSDLDDDVEHLTCDVCDRAFPTLKQLAAHQRKKRHYGCLQCDSIFPSREVLEYHREQMCHYDYAIDVYEEGAEEDDFFESEDDENGIKDEENCEDEERERLL